MIELMFQSASMSLAIPVTASKDVQSFVIAPVAALIGTNDGTNSALFTSFTMVRWGLKGVGLNYAIVLTAWAATGFVLSRLQPMLKASSGSLTSSWIAAGILFVAGAALTQTIIPPPKTTATGG